MSCSLSAQPTLHNDKPLPHIVIAESEFHPDLKNRLWLVVEIIIAVSDRDWIGLDLLNDDTHPSGHISRPTEVNVSQSCFHSLTNYSSLIILARSRGWLKLINCIKSDRKIRLLAGIPLNKSQELSLREYSRFNCVVFSRHSCNTTYSRNIWSMISVWP